MLPNGFKFGFSECGFQFEMGLSDTDPNSDWYVWTHDRRNIEQHYVSGDLPENGVAYWDLYHKDHDLADSINMNAGRIGIEWSRIFPNSTIGIDAEVEKNGDEIVSVDVTESILEKLDSVASSEAVEHYRKMFNDWKSREKFLVINLYHWSLPLWLNNPYDIPVDATERALGGAFDNRIITEFAKYAAYIAWKFDDLADMWVTMNEPNMVFQFCSTDRSRSATSARKKKFAEGHARAYDAIKQYSKKPVGMIYANGDLQPFQESDERAAEIARYTIRFSFFDYIINGDLGWHTGVDAEGMEDEHEPDIRDHMKNKVDWIGVNYYSRDLVRTAGNGWEIVNGYGHATGDRIRSEDGRSVSQTGWEVYPEGIYNVVMEYHNRYTVPMMITENGMADPVDSIRPRYLVSHINQLERAVKDGADLRGYFHWALTDNYEWASGFSKKFGLFGVDLRNKKRQLRPSALLYSKIAENSGVPDDLMWITETKI